MALDRRLGRVIVVAVVFMTIMLFLQPTRPYLGTADSENPLVANSRPEIRFKPSSFDWTTVVQRHPVSSIRPLPTGASQPLQPVQHAFPNYVHDATTKRRQQTVRAAFVKSWESYKKQAWLRDELAPTTIRHLAGLLSAYDLSGEPALLEKAKELGNMLYMAFDTPNRMPGFWFNFQDAKEGRQTAGTNDPSASPCSLSLEFTRLSLLTGDPKFYDAVARISDFLERSQSESKLPGIWPKLINFREQAVDTEIGFTLGALADSLYEYLPKMSALLSGRVPAYEKMYRAAMKTSKQHMLFRPMVPLSDDDEGQDVLFAGDAYVHPDRIDHIAEGQHLSCFAGGMFGLGGKLFDIPDHVDIGERLARGCAWAYNAFPTGLMPEIFNVVSCDSIDGPCAWDEERWQSEGGKRMPKGFKSAHDPRYILRPEAIESIFLLYRMTGKEDFRDLAWRMFESVMRATETPLANSAIADVTVEGKTTKTDSMESFWLAETLKYYYLIFSPPDLISLDEFVLNTEAHPFRRAKSTTSL
ncbi:hypothetical protein CHGG_10675 [Chaetomium globosum CBS 148.51]|uniref:alpha-1,2-Mannosidase n=1 Tax=Chaetomium globosum (strain ATCC 6205 / CBS 148.51 / DSM 1962 / NBRC 6347 / NRRL 1970) TaxID=306901 RepID=Q2GMX9_CHAGB|nr:uncharacterized protein CHGG_10675 [Chaetomium globosum CBS 148.51]EAQ84271.1 hypothetical protein CHGG_10675 [Chaetomium globosum CBS 148.51]